MKHATHLSLIALPAILLGARALLPGGGQEVELDEAEVFIEFNSTDGDFGLQLFWDGDAWSRMNVADPDGKAVLRVQASGRLKEQGLAEGFFESDEPSLDELSMEEFLARFPEGAYAFDGKTLEGELIAGEAELTHTLPAPPASLFPAAGALIDSTLPLVLGFDAVTTDFDGNPLEIESYEVVLEHEGELDRVFSLILPGDTALPSVEVPPVFLLPGEVYKLEVIAQEESGNRTISETVFETL